MNSFEKNSEKKGLKPYFISIAILNGLVLITILILALNLYSISNSQDSQKVVDRWAVDGSRYSQITIFFEDSDKINLSQIYNARYNFTEEIETQVSKNKKEDNPFTVNENARQFIDAYSAERILNLTSNRDGYAPNATVNATLTGGDYFLFHPVKLLSGSYYSENYVMKDQILIDENLAWQFFGSNDIVGQSVTIAGKNHYISGVYEVPKDDANAYVYGEKPRIYMPYDFYTTNHVDNENPILSYEVCMPNVIQNFALDLVEKYNFASEESSEIIENSVRYNFINLAKKFFDSGENAVITKKIVYPYWENSAKITESISTKIVGIILILAIIPILSLFVFAIYIYSKRKAILRKIIENLKRFFFNISRKTKTKIPERISQK